MVVLKTVVMTTVVEGVVVVVVVDDDDVVDGGVNPGESGDSDAADGGDILMVVVL